MCVYLFVCLFICLFVGGCGKENWEKLKEFCALAVESNLHMLETNSWFNEVRLLFISSNPADMPFSWLRWHEPNYINVKAIYHAHWICVKSCHFTQYRPQEILLSLHIFLQSRIGDYFSALNLGILYILAVSLPDLRLPLTYLMRQPAPTLKGFRSQWHGYSAEPYSL